MECRLLSAGCRRTVTVGFFWGASEKRDMKQEVEENRQMDMQSYRKQKRESSSMDIIELLLYHEILRRRCKYRKQCRRYY